MRPSISPLMHTSAVTALSFTGFTNNDRPSTLVTRTFPLGKYAASSGVMRCIRSAMEIVL